MKWFTFIFFTLFISVGLNAQSIEVVGSMQQPIMPSAQIKSRQLLKAPSKQYKNISLLRIKLSSDAQKTFLNRRKSILTSIDSSPRSEFGKHVQLGMNRVPVFDQGLHGTCATFAATAAIDAALNRGDYISQLCLLQLGQTLERFSNYPSGWDGSLGKIILNEIEWFGVVNKENEALGCGGVTMYPLNEDVPKSEMSLEEYHKVSISLEEQVGWSSILDVSDLHWNKPDTLDILNQVKASLDEGSRVTAGFLLLQPRIGTAGATGSYQAMYDTWVLTDDLLRDLIFFAEMGGHAMVVTGYDDNATVIDHKGVTHHGLLTLRSSWGEDVGDHGDFYMTYDYFQLAILEAYRIRRF